MQRSRILVTVPALFPEVGENTGRQERQVGATAAVKQSQEDCRGCHEVFDDDPIPFRTVLRHFPLRGASCPQPKPEAMFGAIRSDEPSVLQRKVPVWDFLGEDQTGCHVLIESANRTYSVFVEPGGANDRDDFHSENCLRASEMGCHNLSV